MEPHYIKIRLSVDFKDKGNWRSTTKDILCEAVPVAGYTLFIENFNDCGRKNITLWVKSISMSALGPGPEGQLRVLSLILVHCLEVEEA